MPKIQAKNRGLKGTWRKQPSDKPIIVHVNKPQIVRNRKNRTQHPVITVRQVSRKTYCDRLEIDGRKCRGLSSASGDFLGLFHSRVDGSCRIVYRPDAPLPCGAVVWIEISSDSIVIPLNKLHRN
jgi:hypothetical protein